METLGSSGCASQSQPSTQTANQRIGYEPLLWNLFADPPNVGMRGHAWTCTRGDHPTNFSLTKKIWTRLKPPIRGSGMNLYFGTRSQIHPTWHAWTAHAWAAWAAHAWTCVGMHTWRSSNQLFPDEKKWTQPKLPIRGSGMNLYFGTCSQTIQHGHAWAAHAWAAWTCTRGDSTFLSVAKEY
jgi:hypothetical protein